MTAREIIQKRLNHEGTAITPYEFRFGANLERRIAEHYKDENWRSKMLRKFLCHYLHADTHQLKPIDDIYSRDAYGALWRMDKKPWHLETPPLAEPSFEGYNFPGAEVFVAPILADKPAAIEQYNADDEHYRMITMGWGVFEHTWGIRGFENTLMDTITDEDFYQELVEKITDIHVAMVRACADVPADAFFFGDDWGDQRGVIIGAARWRKFIKPCWAKIYAEAHKQGKKIIHHCCGSVIDIYEDMIEIGLDCHESVQPEAHGMNPDVLKAKFGSRMSFWGCLGSQSLLTSGTPAEISREIKRLNNLFKEDGGYILAPAKPLLDEMDLDRALAVVETLAELNG